MTKKEREILIGIVNDIRRSNDEIDGFTRLYETIKKMINYEYEF